MAKLYQQLDLDSGVFESNFYDSTNKNEIIKSFSTRYFEPEYLLLKLYQIVQYIDENVALKTELRLPGQGGGRKKSRKHKKRKSKKSRKHRRKSKRHS